MSFEVSADYHDTNMCYLIPPEEETLLTEETYVVILQMRDKYSNKCSRGGDVVSAKLGYIKQGVADSTQMTSDNHTINVEDRADGTYAISINLMLGKSEKAPFPSGVNVEVNLDRDSKERPTGINLEPLSLWFQRNPATQAASGGLKGAGKLVQSANHAIKMMKGPGGKGGAPAAAPAAAAPAPASAGKDGT